MASRAQSRRFQQVVGRSRLENQAELCGFLANAVPGKMLRLKTCTSLYSPCRASSAGRGGPMRPCPWQANDQVDLDADALIQPWRRTPRSKALRLFLRSIFSCASASMDCKPTSTFGEVGLAQQPAVSGVMPSPRSSPK